MHKNTPPYDVMLFIVTGRVSEKEENRNLDHDQNIPHGREIGKQHYTNTRSKPLSVCGPEKGRWYFEG